MCSIGQIGKYALCLGGNHSFQDIATTQIQKGLSMHVLLECPFTHFDPQFEQFAAYPFGSP
jgi:hypothetical protein